MNDTLMMMPVELSFIKEAEDLKKIKFDDAFFKIIASPNQSNKKWVTEQQPYASKTGLSETVLSKLNRVESYNAIL